ncbi:MAG: TVP38/TMEM64 family protein [Brevibacterium aurantiacum]|uniref:TVP38/TMEM64 family membrane protein n=1 Tax=Brevibacterium aurantiacum TaxID=273384 RepID=A0A1D7VYH2_BREAU|nr:MULTISPECIES: TVP38/TMEM64 family protein [Brevibacterium]MDN5594919.1 TVP38/TMEM64 family protein [Brevibacterium sp.]AOP51879.1 membrane protein [Brevibacterium aurantiacum]AZL04328.1 TVP38/TMEM64 family protein [Brevibacterium aurantiacum]AZL07927.1 TVP38/TMEM64 family protein [Brevibacterium aurantiacum]AZL11535.1 TVP38/TMEM64 family protein [Brevibacterium aurantiacum]
MPNDENPALNPGSHGTSKVPWGSILRNVALALAVLAGLWLVFNVHLPSLDGIQKQIADAGFWGFGIFIILYALVAATPIPVTIMAVAGGLAFGLIFGTILSMIGVVAGCVGGYWVARGLGRDTVMKLLGNHAAAIESRLTNGGFYAVCILRLMPGFPYWPVNYGSGAMGIKSRTFLIATVISALPGQLSLVAVGAFIGNPGIVTGTAVGISWALVIVLTILTFRRWKSEQKDSTTPETEDGYQVKGQKTEVEQRPEIESKPEEKPES